MSKHYRPYNFRERLNQAVESVSAQIMENHHKANVMRLSAHEIRVRILERRLQIEEDTNQEDEDEN